MRFSNHIANRLLTDPILAFEIIQKMYPEIDEVADIELLDDDIKYKIRSLHKFLQNDAHKVFLITSTVLDKLDMLHVKPNSENRFDWTVFNKIIGNKYTLILPPDKNFAYGRALRIQCLGDVLEVVVMRARKNDEETKKKKGTDTELLWTFFFVDTETNRHSESCKIDKEFLNVHELVYKLLCFVFLSENEYELIKAGESRGTKKNGKIKNDLPVPLTIINSKWNITSIRTEGFIVRGHFALRRCGVGRSQTRMVYIEPFEKHGYVRRSQKQDKI